MSWRQGTDDPAGDSVDKRVGFACDCWSLGTKAAQTRRNERTAAGCVRVTASLSIHRCGCDTGRAVRLSALLWPRSDHALDRAVCVPFSCVCHQAPSKRLFGGQWAAAGYFVICPHEHLHHFPRRPGARRWRYGHACPRWHSAAHAATAATAGPVCRAVRRADARGVDQGQDVGA